MSTRTGFSLIELIIVIVIIGILVGIATPSYRNSIERAKCAQALSTLKSMRNAMEQYFQQEGTFATATIPLLEGLVNADFSPTPIIDWDFTIVGGATASAYVLQAERMRGEFDGEVITLDQDEQWSDPDIEYPWDQ